MSQDADTSPADRLLGPIRLGIGLAHGLAVYGLYKAWTAKAWPATEPVLFGPLLLVAALTPIMLLGGIAALRRRTLAATAVVTVALLAIFGAYDILRQAAPTGNDRLSLQPLTVFISAVTLFIAYHLVVPADQARRWIAPYAAYFDAAWKDAVQLALSAAFTGVLWGVLFLGATLFAVIGIEGFRTLITKEWFAYPMTGLAFAGAVHLTDVRIGLIRGIRTVGLTLLAWLMPLMAGIAAAFLCALPFTGLDPLWETRRATAVLLSAAAALIILLNAAYQDGEAERNPPMMLRHAARLAGVVLAPIVAIAGYGLALRVGQYGWTPDRIIAAACVVAASCYAVGYLIAAVRPGGWMTALPQTNIATSLVVLALVVALFTPIADPARVSVSDQVARLTSGRIAPDKFDYRFLRFEAGRYGMEALNRLKATATGPNAATIAAKADEALRSSERYQAAAERRRVAPQELDDITVYPAGSSLPDGFRDQDWSESAFTCPRRRCDAYLFDLDGDGANEVLVSHMFDWQVFGRGEDGKWSRIGSVSAVDCEARDALRVGRAARVEPRWKDVEIGGKRFAFASTPRVGSDLSCRTP